MLATESLWFGRAEGVRVTYDRDRVPFTSLLAVATAAQCDLFVWTTTDAQLDAARRAVGARAQAYAKRSPLQPERRDKEQQYYLHKSPLRFVPMTRPQATRVNAALRRGPAGARRWLSPAQRRWLEQVEAAPDKPWPVAHGVPLRAALAAFRRAATD
ncbi:MAG: hypothetical protein ACON4Z_08705 [Planctomycetota bacterium]